MTRQEGWNPNRAGEISVSPGVTFSPDEIEERAFKIEPIEYKGRTIKFVSIESQMQYTKDRTDFVPPDWTEQVAATMQDTSLVFVPYFPPELEKTAYSSRLLGERARSWGQQMLHGIYQTVADLAAEQGKSVAVCDIANKIAFLPHERVVPTNRVPLILGLSAYGVQISKSEKFIPQAVDARRMFTARGITQTIEGYPEGSTFMYVAAPAHINRVKKYVTEKPSLVDRARYTFYENMLLGLDTFTRIYEPTDAGWSLRSHRSYCKPGGELVHRFFKAQTLRRIKGVS